MRRIGLFLMLASALAQPGKNPFAGRWDITVTTPRDTYPDWLEVVDKDGKLEVRMQPRGGTVHPVSEVKMVESHLLLTVSAGGRKGPATLWDLTMQGSDKLVGVQTSGDHNTARLAGVRAAALNRPAPKAWSDPEPIFNGKDLTGWEPIGNNSHWVVEDGTMVNQSKGANVKTTRQFDDFKLHIEFNCPPGGNSGIYLRGRYEVQVEYETPAEDPFHAMGSIYGFLAPAVELPRKPGEWETFDITLIGRTVTVIRDRVKTIDNQEIAGITGGALDAHEAEPGPFVLQGDHTGGMKYRNITVSVGKR